MVSLTSIVTAFQDRLRLIPEVVSLLGGDPLAISAYIDLTPTRNNAANDIYTSDPGTIRIYYELTDHDQPNEMSPWTHHVNLVLKAAKGTSNLDLTTAVVNGKHVPGDGQKWWVCPLLTDLDPTQIVEISRVSDTESVDYFLITTQTDEIGDM